MNKQECFELYRVMSARIMYDYSEFDKNGIIGLQPIAERYLDRLLDNLYKNISE